MAISTQELQQLIEEKSPFTLIEALPNSHFQAKHLPSAINIPHDEIEQRISDLPADKAALLVTYCAGTTCQNSVHAKQALAKLGFTNVREYLGGKESWEAAGLPFE